MLPLFSSERFMAREILESGDAFVTPDYRLLDTDGFVIQRTQEITDDFLQRNSDLRFQSSQAPAKDLHQFASIPVAVVEKWWREGFDIYNESARSIISRLRYENLDAFITTTKRI
jgi:hypothetical protein